MDLSSSNCIYVVWPEAAIDKGDFVYKVGYSSNISERLRGYGSKSVLKCVLFVHNAKVIEKSLHKYVLFKYVRRDYGDEYYEEKAECLISKVCKFVSEYAEEPYSKYDKWHLANFKDAHPLSQGPYKSLADGEDPCDTCKYNCDKEKNDNGNVVVQKSRCDGFQADMTKKVHTTLAYQLDKAPSAGSLKEETIQIVYNKLKGKVALLSFK